MIANIDRKRSADWLDGAAHAQKTERERLRQLVASFAYSDADVAAHDGAALCNKMLKKILDRIDRGGE